MKPRLIFKLLAINIPLIVGVIAVIWLAIDYLAADYFMVLMDRYHVNPSETHGMFLESIHRYILWASAGGLLLAVALSYLLTRRVLKPLEEMSAVTSRIATGDYASRIQARSRDEVGGLADAFNRMADDLERIEQLRKTMVSDVAHELRTPLTNVRGYLEGLKDGVVKPTPEIFNMLQEEVLRLVNLVADLGQLTRADAAHKYLNREPLDLGELTAEVLALFLPDFEKKGIKPSLQCTPGGTPVRADRDQTRQVLRNLIQNALQYTPAQGEVTIACGAENGGAVLTITNSGDGIPEDDLPLIFERFYRVDKSRSRDSGGAGIGLAIVKQLVEAHGGEITVRSDHTETTFRFSLPG